jgi:23S rRNA maturation mini-RNase III
LGVWRPYELIRLRPIQLETRRQAQTHYHKPKPLQGAIMEYLPLVLSFIGGAVVAVLIMSQLSKSKQGKILADADAKVEKAEREVKDLLNKLEAKAKKVVKRAKK